MKKKKILIITLVLGILFLTSYLYSSYATSTGVSLGNDENTYDILLNDSTDTVSVPAKSSKSIYYQFSNTNKGTIKYHIGYTSNNVMAKVWWDTEDKISGTIEQGEYKFIKLKLINDTTEDDTITIKPVLGYVNGGDVIPDSNTSLITTDIKETNTMSIAPSTALNTLGIDKTTVEEISFVNDNIVPSDALGSTTVSFDNSVMLWYTASDTEGMYKVYIGSDNGITSFPANSLSLFNGFTKMTSINLDNINISNVTSMQNMFRNCSKLTTIDLSNFDTTNNTSMTAMFQNCSSLTEIDLSNFSNLKAVSMYETFSGCTNLTSVDLGNMKISNMYRMFLGCSKLVNVNLSDVDTSSVENMGYMFQYCSNLKNLNISNFDTSNVKIMTAMFSGCSSLKSLDLSNFNTSNVTTMSNMFNGCRSLTNLDLSNFDTSIVTNMSNMFYNTTIRNLNISNFTLGTTNVSGMFGVSRNLTLIDMSNADFTNTTNNTNVFNQVPVSVDIYLKDTQGNREFMSNNFSSYTNVQYIPSS